MSIIDSDLKYVDMSWVVDNEQYGSLNNPIVMVGEDNVSYLVKFNKPQDFRIGINELVCNLIGLELELPVFKSVIANVSQDIINSNKKLKKNCPGGHFAQAYLEPFETVSSSKSQGKQIDADMIGNIRSVPDFVIFDKYIENFDRHGGNICLLENKNLENKVDYYLFDHDLAFQRCHEIKNDISGLREMKTKLRHMEFLVEKITKKRLFDRGISRVVSLSSSIPDIIKKIPTVWKDEEGDYIVKIEALLMEFTKSMADNHILLNRDRFPLLQ